MIGQNGHHVAIPKPKKSSKCHTDTERILIALEQKNWIMNFKNVPIHILLGRNGLIALSLVVEAKASCSDPDKCAKANLKTKLRTLLAALDTLVTHVIHVTSISTFLKIIALVKFLLILENHQIIQSAHFILECNCDCVGSESASCTDNDGACTCKVGYSGVKCENCDEGFFRDEEGNCIGKSTFCCLPTLQNIPKLSFEIIECGCDATKGSEDVQCDPTGQCPCKDSYIGLKCDICEDYYFLDASGTCQSM